jgi:hypothetical protein
VAQKSESPKIKAMVVNPKQHQTFLPRYLILLQIGIR